MFELPLSVKDHPFITLIAGFLLGIAAYEGILKIAQLEIEPKLSSCSNGGEISLRFETSPNNANILFSDSSNTFFQNMCLRSGRYQFLISAKGYKTIKRTVHLDRTDRIEIITLPGIININLSGSESKKYPKDMPKLSLNFQQIEVKSVLQIIADFVGRNIVIPQGIDQLITLHLNDVPWEEVLDALLLVSNLEVQKTNNIIIITKKYRLQSTPNSKVN